MPSRPTSTVPGIVPVLLHCLVVGLTTPTSGLLAQPTGEVIAQVESALAERDARIAALEAGAAVYAKPEDWPAPPAELTWPVHRVIELGPGVQPFPWVLWPEDAPPGTRIVVRGKRIDERGRPVNIRPALRGSARWSRRLEGTVVEFQGIVFLPDPDTTFFEFGEELDVIVRDCYLRGDVLDTRDALNHHRTGFMAVIDTQVSGAAFGLKGVDYARGVRLYTVTDDAIQSTPILEGTIVDGLVRYRDTHADAVEYAAFEGIRWDGLVARHLDGGGIIAKHARDVVILNSTIDMASDYAAYALAIQGDATDVRWWGGAIRGRVRVLGEVDNVEFRGVAFETPDRQIKALADKGVRFIDCTNRGEPLLLGQGL
ncbi:MAG: hypothetical protein AAGI54_09940 [Planctomycetota bacterium]